jgi:hypothetical protein
MLQVRKQLVSFANNEYIFWADADDYLSEDAFKNLVKTSDNQKPDLIIGKTKFHFFNSLMFQKLTANMFSKRTKTKERWMVQNGVFL